MKSISDTVLLVSLSNFKRMIFRLVSKIVQLVDYYINNVTFV